MKKFKKVFAVLLTLAMVLGMSITSFAVNNYKIKVNGLEPGTKVSYVQIVEQDDTKESGNDWKLTSKAASIGMSVEQLEEIGKTNNASEGTINANLSGLNFSSLTVFEGTATANAEGVAEISVTKSGLYAIKADTTENVVYSWMVAYVGINDDDNTANVTAKGATNQVTKIVEEGVTSIGAGEEVGYQVEVKYPYFAENVNNKSFVITDTLTNGTFVKDSVSIKVNGVENGSLTPNNYAYSDTLTITLDTSKYDSSLAGKNVVITYTVKANDDISSAKELANEVKSTIKQDKDSEEGDETTSRVELPSFDVNVSKTDEDGNVITGSEAKFQLYIADPDSKVTIDVEGENDPVAVKAVGEEVTTANGVATFTGLAAEEDGPYYVKETQAPEGYQLNAKAYKLTGASAELVGPTLVNGVMLTTYNETTKTEYNSVGFGDGLNFHDTKLASLPSTGGIGTTIFTIGGCAIMIIAAALFFASRRKAVK